MPQSQTLDVIGFDAGYVGVGYDEPVNLKVWFSEDGIVWENTSLPPSSGPSCEDYDWEVIVKAVTDGRSTILLAEHNRAENCQLQTYAWVTSDGRNWQRSAPVGEPHDPSEENLLDIWAVPDGWEAAVNNADESTAVLHSADGVTWTQTATVSGFGSPDGAADATGSRVLSLTTATSSFGTHAQERLLMSSDGLTWTDIEVTFGRDGLVAAVSAIEPPIASGSEWFLVVDEFDMDASFPDWSRGSTLWLSLDLAQWEEASPPGRSAVPVLATSQGLIANACKRQCAMYLTQDGREWTRTLSVGERDRGLQWVAEGRAGILAATDDGAVYRLVP